MCMSAFWFMQIRIHDRDYMQRALVQIWIDERDYMQRALVRWPLDAKGFTSLVVFHFDLKDQAPVSIE